MRILPDGAPRSLSESGRRENRFIPRSSAEFHFPAF
jgi:hypothetical protein